MNVPRHTLVLLFAAVFAITAGCNSARQGDAALAGDDDILARVNGDDITSYDLERAVVDMLGPQFAGYVDDEVRKAALESLVLSKVMALEAEQHMNAEDVLRLKKDIAAYREQWLVKRYLREQAAAESVTDDMVREYYENNAARFGGGVSREYEMLVGTRALQGSEVRQVTRAMEAAASEQNWRAYAGGLKPLPVQYRRGGNDESILHGTLRSALRGLKVGETSAPMFVEGRAYVLRVTNEVRTQPKPLEEVRTEIRETLAPVQLKKAIDAVSDKLLAEANVEYVNEI